MTDVLAPVAGAVQALADVPDPVFAGEIVGSGVAVAPSADGPVEAVSPVDGTVVKLHPHAYVVVAADGTGVLVHLGIDTVQLGGEGFELLAAEGQTVTAGQPVVRWDPAAIAAGGRSAVVPVVLMDSPPGTVVAGSVGSDVDAGAVLFSL
ncbi:PTS sugar transporter subunit IIA [Solicola sp. PLA-1-18]|uniref:PTS sugar transporter subunit IIA n=1 Tax=Solicola sp. PLA-1-18 TaxID=3380532 RepID=UPI003B7E7CEC